MIRKFTRSEFVAHLTQLAAERGVKFDAKRDLRTPSLTIDKMMIDEEARTVELSFSSETPIKRWWGWETLDHSKKAVDLTRLNTGGAVLVDHNPERQVGVVEKAWIQDRRGKATCRYSTNPRAEEEWIDIKNRIRQLTSVGYDWDEIVLEKSDKETGDWYTVTRWSPLEISTVSIAADISVGVARSEEWADGPEIRDQRGGDQVMEKCQVCGNLLTECKCSAGGSRQAVAVAPAPAPPAPEINVGRERQSATDAERERVTQIVALGTRFERREMADAAVRDGTPLDAFRGKLLEELKSGPSPVIRPLRESDAEIGMGPKDVRRYSVLKLLRAISEPTNRGLQEDAAFEFECSSEFQKVAVVRGLRREIRGVSIPEEVMRAPIGASAPATGKRAFEVGDGDKGGYLVATELRMGSMIEYLWKRVVVSPLVTMVPGLVGNVLLPKETGEASAYWIAEDGTATEFTAINMFGQVSLVPKTVAIRTGITRKLMMQTSLAIEGVVRNHIAKKFGSEIERVIINGTGAGEPAGILKTTGIGSVTFGGAAVSWARCIEAITDVMDSNADVARMAFLTNALVWGQAMAVPKAGDYPVFVCDDQNRIAGYPVLVTSHVPKTLGAGANRSALIFGNFEDVYIGTWGGIDLIVDNISSNSAQTIIKGFQDVDISLGHAESFSAGQDIDPTAVV